ncbi:MAG: tetratricopeptide repeat protein [Myxococcota bacterium]
MRRVALLLLVPVLLAAKLDRVEKLQAEGAHAEVVALVGGWKEKGQLGKEEAALVAALEESALAIALADGKAAALGAFREAHPESPLVPEALEREHDLAFQEAQAEGTAAAMGAYRARYPDSPYASRAAALEQGWAYEEAVAEGTLAALERFLAVAGDSPYRATAWEAVAARTPGVTVLDGTGRPHPSPPLPVTDGRVALPDGLPEGTPRLTYAVNVEGAGRGETSEWFGLRAVGPDGVLLDRLPLEVWLAEKLGVDVALSLGQLAAADGAHTARVAESLHPLLLPGTCEGARTFALVLAEPGGAATAWPFTVPCPRGEPAGDTPAGKLAVALLAAEAGDRAAAHAAWDEFARTKLGAPIVAALKAKVGEDVRGAVLDARPAAGDVIAWSTRDGKTESVWLHEVGDEVRVLARRPGLVVATPAGLRTLRATEEPWTAGCKAPPTLAGVSLADLDGERATPVFADAATRLAGMASRSIEPLGSVGPLLFLLERAVPCKGSPVTTFLPVAADTGFPASVLGDPAIADAAVAAAKERLGKTKDRRSLDQLAVYAHHPAFPDGGDLVWRFELARGTAPPVSQDAGALPAKVEPWADTPAMLERFWDGEPPGDVAGWSRVEGEAGRLFAGFVGGT